MPPANNPIVVNTTPLLALDACAQLDLLRQLHSRVIVPVGVERELSVGGGSTSLPHGLTADHRQWIEVLPLTQSPSQFLLDRLDTGEAEVIALALELGVSDVLIDERLGRRAAAALGLKVAGSLAVLLRAKRTGLIVAVKPCVDAMVKNNIHLGAALIRTVLQHAGE